MLGIAFAAVIAYDGFFTAKLAHADQPTQADALFAEGRDLLEKGRYAEACEKLQKSDKLAPAVGTLLNLGFCWEQVVRMRSAMDAYSEAEILAREGGDEKRAQFARDRFAAVEAKVMRLTVRVEGETLKELSVTRNGQVIQKTDWGKPIAVDPEEFVITASAPDHITWRGVIMGKGDAAVVTIVVPPLVPVGARTNVVVTSLPPRRIAAVALGGFAIASFAVGSALALSAKSRHDDSLSHCDASGCDDTGAMLQSGAVAQGNVATVFAVVGVLSLGVGVYLWLTGGGGGSAATTPPEKKKAYLNVGTIGARF